MSRKRARLLLWLLLPMLIVSAPSARAASPDVVASNAGTPALIENALGEVPPDDPRMESYSHGNDLLRLVGFLWRVGVLVLILGSGFAATLLTWSGRAGHSPSLRVAVYTTLLASVAFVARFPFSVYAGYWREKQYGFANRSFAAWMGDRTKLFLVELVLEVILFVGLYAGMRRLGRRWWMAGSVLATLGAVVVIAITPVFIAPLFNTFEPLKDADLRAGILEMARREGIPADDVFQVDASRQSSHTNAYVVGLLGTQRIVLYDTLLEKFAPREIKAIMGHEMGHYVLHHVWKSVAFAALLIVTGLFVVDRVARRVIARRAKLGIAALEEPSSMPLIVVVLYLYLFSIGPVIATFSRMQEHQADLFGLEATNDPEAMASAFLKFGRIDLEEYHVHPWIEALTYSHPSLARRIETARDFARRHGQMEGHGTSGPP